VTPSCLVHDSNVLEEPVACIRRVYSRVIEDVETERHSDSWMGSPKNMHVAVALVFENNGEKSRLINIMPVRLSCLPVHSLLV
jgi:hypothetical protein